MNDAAEQIARDLPYVRSRGGSGQRATEWRADCCVGGVAQEIGTALYEEMPYDAEGQPLATTLADYLLPGATEVPVMRIAHMETPSPLSYFGQKGIGEGGAIGPPAAIANAVNDALAPLGAEITELPMTPRRVLAALRATHERRTAIPLPMLPAQVCVVQCQAISRTFATKAAEQQLKCRRSSI